MAQSDLYKRTTGTQTFNLSSDDARDLGDVDVKSFNGSALDISDDGSRILGETQVTNSVQTIPDGNDVQTFETTINGTETLPTFDVEDNGELLLYADPNNDSTDPILIEGTLPLAPDSSIPLPVSNADVIDVETTNAQTLHGIAVVV